MYKRHRVTLELERIDSDDAPHEVTEAFWSKRGAERFARSLLTPEGFQRWLESWQASVRLRDYLYEPDVPQTEEERLYGAVGSQPRLRSVVLPRGGRLVPIAPVVGRFCFEGV